MLLSINKHLAPYESLNGSYLDIRGKRYKLHVSGAYVSYPFRAFKYSGNLEEIDCPHSHSFTCLVVGSAFDTVKAKLDEMLTRALLTSNR